MLTWDMRVECRRIESRKSLKVGVNLGSHSIWLQLNWVNFYIQISFPPFKKKKRNSDNNWLAQLQRINKMKENWTVSLTKARSVFYFLRAPSASGMALVLVVTLQWVLSRWSRWNHLVHFTYKETETQWGKLTCLRSHSLAGKIKHGNHPALDLCSAFNQL